MQEEKVFLKDWQCGKLDGFKIKHELMWVDSYAPSRAQDIIGNSMNITKIQHFLLSFHESLKKNPNHKRALFIYGPPGSGKTTSAQLIARLCSFETREFNASDVRKKGQLKTRVSGATHRHSIGQFFKKDSLGVEKEFEKGKGMTCVIMDEVDGMSGGADRGGMQELKDIIIKSKVPVICIANDGGNKKLMTLKKYCTVIQWSRPSEEQILPHLTKIVQKEQLGIDTKSLLEIIHLTNHDIRQCLHSMQILARSSKSASFHGIKDGFAVACADESLNTLTAVRRLFCRCNQDQSYINNSHSWIDKYIDYHSVDTQLIPLFVADQYLQSKTIYDPRLKLRPDVQSMESYASAAESISDGDLVGQQLYRAQDYSLEEVHASMATIIPAWHTGGGLKRQVYFPSWFGKNSSIQKKYRELFELRKTWVFT